MSKIALIDGDSIGYICSKDTENQSLKLVDSLLLNIIRKVEASSAIVFLSAYENGQYFRHKINPNYKSNRPPSKLLWLKQIKLYLKDKYSAYEYPGVEADDLVCYFGNIYKENSIICSIDKDVFKSISGKHFDYKKVQFITQDQESAARFLWFQTLMGDSTDNIKGIPGIGEKTAMDILNNADPSEYQLRVYNAYLNYYKTPNLAMHYMQLNFKMVYLLKSEEDFNLYFPDRELPTVDKQIKLEVEYGK